MNESGLISGTPTQAGTTAFNVRAFVSSAVSSDLVLILKVNPGGEESSDKYVRIITSTLPAAEMGKEYSATLESNPSGATWTHSGGTLPAGLMLGTDGKIIGIPLQVGSFDFTVKASYPSYTDGEKQLTISVSQSSGSSVNVGSSGGGCDSGMRTTALLLSFIASIIKRKR